MKILPAAEPNEQRTDCLFVPDSRFAWCPANPEITFIFRVYLILMDSYHTFTGVKLKHNLSGS